MRKLALLAVPALAIGFLAPACHRKSAAAPWIQVMPSDSQMAVSGRLGWLADNPSFRKYLAQSPAVEQALDLFIQRAHINPKTDPGRLTLHLMDTPNGATPTKGFLIALDQFQDPAALQSSLAANFPPEGTLRWGGKECPLHVVLDIDTPKLKAHLRALGDPSGRIWIGDLDTLTKAATASFGPSPSLASAAAWVSTSAPLQGFLRPQGLLKALHDQVPDSLADQLPQGIDFLVWSVAPPSSPDQPYDFQLAASGDEASVVQVTPWIQRLAAVAGSVQKGQTPAPDIISEKTRVGLHMRLTAEQLEQVMEKLGQSFIPVIGQADTKA